MEEENDRIYRVAIVGPESTGKSTLASALADHYNTAMVPEFAREFLETRENSYTETDLLTMAKGQLELEHVNLKHANQILICDTNLLVIKIWSEFQFKRCDPQIINLHEKADYDLVLLTDVDVPWESDPLREHPEESIRKELFELYLNELIDSGSDYLVVHGSEKERLEFVVREIDQRIAN